MTKGNDNDKYDNSNYRCHVWHRNSGHGHCWHVGAAQYTRRYTIRSSSRSSVELLYLVGPRGAQGYGVCVFSCLSSSTAASMHTARFMSVGLLDSTCYQCYQVRELLLSTINTAAVDLLLHISSTPGYQAAQNIKHNYKPGKKKLLFGVSLRFLFVTQGQVTFLRQDSRPPKVRKY